MSKPQVEAQQLVQPLPVEQADQLRRLAEQLRDIFREKSQVELDYDEESVRWLDEYIETTRSKTNENERQAAISLIGSFLGECFIRKFGGRWAMCNGMTGVMFDEKNGAFPYNKVAKQYENGAGAGDSIFGYYQITASFREALTPAQNRLLEFSHKSDHRIFVPRNMGETTEWQEVQEITGPWVILKRHTASLALTQLNSFYVCSPSGRLLHSEWINKSYWETLPAEILEQIKHSVPAETSLTIGQLEHGKQFVGIEYGKSNHKKEGYHFYSTRLKNISSRKIKIIRFGGYLLQGGTWQLATVTGDFYTADNFRDWYQQEGEWLMPGETACDTSNYGEPPVLWAYFCETDDKNSFVAGKVLEKPVADAAGSGAHYVTPVPPHPETEQIIAALRHTCEQAQRQMTAFALACVAAPKPSWMTGRDGLNEIFRQQNLLLKEGKIVWGALVQANSLLFEPGNEDCPAILIYSTDAYFDSRPQELQLIAHKLFSFKETDPTDPELKEIARRVTDEMDRSMGFTLPRVFSDKEIGGAAFMVFRQHIPGGVLSSGLFPILIHPSTQAVMIVPSKFWPSELITMWKKHGK